MILRNGIKLGYPFKLAIESLKGLCDEVIVAVDPTSEDDTVSAVQALHVHVVESVWDMTNHKGFDSSGETPKETVVDEITRQTRIVVGAAEDRGLSTDWIFSLQADEILHPKNHGNLRRMVTHADANHLTGITLPRLYFYSSLGLIRQEWTMPLLRLFRPGCWDADEMSGAMSFVPVGRQGSADMGVTAPIYHYSRMGDPLLIAKRVRNLDTFYHPPAKLVEEVDLAPYDFVLHKHDNTAIKGATSEIDPRARLQPYPSDEHPPGVAEFYEEKP